MKKQLKKVALMAAVTIAALSFSACGEDGEEVMQTGAVSQKTEEAEQTNNNVSIEEQEIFNSNGVIVKATKFDADSLFGPELGLYIENNTDKAVTVQVGNCAVNGYMNYALFSEDVAPGKKSNSTVTFFEDGLNVCGIETFSEIEFEIVVVDSETFETIETSDIVKIKTSAFGTFEQVIDDAGEVLVDENGVKIVLKGLREDDIYDGYEVLLFMENNSGKRVIVQADEASVNGFMIYPFLSETLFDGKASVAVMTIMGEELENNSIEKIEDIETRFNIIDANDWTEVFATDSIVMTFE